MSVGGDKDLNTFSSYLVFAYNPGRDFGVQPRVACYPGKRDV